MTNKQSLPNILIGSLAIASTGAFMHYSAPNLGTFEFAIGLFVLAFVVLLFLTSFLPAHAARKLQPQDKTAGRQERREQIRSKPSKALTQGEKRGPRSQVNYRARRQQRRERYSKHNNTDPEQAPAVGNEVTTQTDDLPPDNIGNSSVLRGNIKWYNRRKGFGFVQFENEEVFFHRNEIKSPPHLLQEDTAVEFVIGDGPKGPQAINLRVV